MNAGLQPRYSKELEWISTGTDDVMVFYPTLEEMRDFSAYVRSCEEKGAHLKSGICKIVPPKEWSPRPKRGLSYSEVDDYIIKAPVKETIANASYGGAYIKENKIYRKEMSVKQFRQLALSQHYVNPRQDLELRDIERQFWRTLCVGEPIYGADTPGSLYDKEVEEFKITELKTILDLLDDCKMKIPGVNTPYLYFGMYKATFSWHTEDMDLYSINYLHFGEPKFWYAIPQSDADKFERLSNQKFPEDAQRCKAYLRHKTHIINPKEFKQHGIKYGTMVQYPGEFIITFPRGYHMGFNLGYNCAESTNFALERWIDVAKATTVCRCVKGSVEIDMAPFMKRFRPDEFEEWYDYWYRPRVVMVKKNQKSASSVDPFFVPSVDLPSIKEDRISEYKTGLDDKRRIMHFLWQHQQDFKEEVHFNTKQGERYPYCSVCQHFTPSVGEYTPRPQRSERYTTDQLYSKSCIPCETMVPLNESRLIQCKRCHVVVHEDCYSVDKYFFDDQNPHCSSDHSDSEATPSKRRRSDKAGWLCKRCDFAREQLVCASVNCAMCSLRGGALIPFVNGQPGLFVHVICAVMSRRSKIVRDEAKGEMYAISSLMEGAETDLNKLREISSISQDYMSYEPDLFLNLNVDCNYQCDFCSQPLKSSFVKCQPCLDSGAHCVTFHPYCAQFADLHFEHRHYPYLALAVCPLHSSENKEDKYPINVGDTAVFFSNLECDRVIVDEVSETFFYFVEFLDCSFSADVSLHDLVDCQCRHVGCNGDHISGYLITVRWENEQTFQGYFREKIPGSAFTVRSLTSGKMRTCSRNALYRLDEAKPEEVEERLAKIPLTI
ncbi:unnamed protein product [Bursaphelenchus xylophilus]|uniref:(pine wood nematode) hypothetical protein n=1 Tax=Bursaphelenchus xylophilus TaxID=6326 RepID=A0A1I7RQ79_BURXY|nr:unnamed protein product [Bursaphelenchus xylophilus]CAG9097285.1 unnamed protein product [Bursaphelenchus xylophilus]